MNVQPRLIRFVSLIAKNISTQFKRMDDMLRE